MTRCITLLAIFLCGMAVHAADLKLSSKRTAFYRDESPVITATISGDFPAKSSLEARLDERPVYVAPAHPGANTITVPPGIFRTGRHDLTARLLDPDGKEVAAGSLAIKLAKRPAADALQNWLWSAGSGVPEDWPFYKEHGFDFAGGPMLPYGDSPPFDEMLQQMDRNLDESLPNGLLVTTKPHGGLWEREFRNFPPKGEDVHYANAGRNGEKYYNPFSPIVAEKQNEANRRFMEMLKDHPNAAIAWTDMEIQDDLTKPNLNREGREKMARELGFTEADVGEPEYVAPHVIADNDRKYRLLKYVFQGGNGVHAALQRMVDVVKEYRPDMLTMTDPFRHVALYDVYPSVDIIHTWTYTNPDPKYALYIEQLRAATKPRNQIPLQVVTLLNYPGMLEVPERREKPPAKDDPHAQWMGMGPDRMKEHTWINLSRAPRFVGYFYGSQINPVKYEKEGYRIPPATSDAIKEMAEKVFRPYGKFIRKLDVSPRRMAVLTSQAASLYGTSPNHGQGGYANYRTVPFQVVLEMAHYNADVVFDESVEQGALDNYDVLFLPRADVLTQTVYEKIKAFQKRGGLVFSDQYLGPELDVAHRFDFDFSYRGKVNARANVEGRTYAEWDDHIEKGKVNLANVKGVPADKDQKIMEGYAKTLKEVVSSKVPHFVDADEPTVLFNVLEKNGVKYLFVINDKRTYDERVGKFKGIMEKLVPQTVTVRVRVPEDENPVVYDMLKRRELPVERNEGGISFPVELDSLGGTMIALQPSRLEKLAVSGGGEGEMGKEFVIPVELRDAEGNPAKGLQPVRVDIVDAKGNLHEDSDWITLEDGRGELVFTPAWNDPAGDWKIRVADLTAGLTTERTISLK